MGGLTQICPLKCLSKLQLVRLSACEGSNNVWIYSESDLFKMLEQSLNELNKK